MPALDDWMPPDQQQRWLTDLEYDDLGGERRSDPAGRAQQADKYQRYLLLPYHDEVTDCLRLLVRLTMPAVRASEGIGWSLACKTELDTYARLQVGQSVTFQADYDEDDDTPLFSFFLPRKLLAEGLGTALEREELVLEIELDDGEPFECLIAPAAVHKSDREQMSLTVTSGEDAAAVIDLLLPQLRAYHLRLMRGGRVPPPVSHCWDLADQVVE